MKRKRCCREELEMVYNVRDEEGTHNGTQEVEKERKMIMTRVKQDEESGK